MKAIEISLFDAAEYLDSEQAIAEYLSAVKEENDPVLLRGALANIAKARSMAKDVNVRPMNKSVSDQ
ncbi:DNA-binding protein [Orrella sp. 11846]|uniref:helix-turn-helix domain-containing transcriptional regulator n=1 Tax=Orrella sp. 11846 TaxID=3409913 RepID=UPI003B5A0F97